MSGENEKQFEINHKFKGGIANRFKINYKFFVGFIIIAPE